MTLVGWAARAAIALSLLGACSEPYRVGEYVLVEWEPGKVYPAYITEASGSTRFRVHFDGYDSRWDEDVSIDRIKGRVEGPVTPPPPPEKVARASQGAKPALPPSASPIPGVAPAPNANANANANPNAGPTVTASPPPTATSVSSASVAGNPYTPGDRVRLTWRGSVYSATVLEVLAKDRVVVHYEGYENAWDEAVHTDRIVSKRP